jgi:hypothetical protein
LPELDGLFPLALSAFQAPVARNLAFWGRCFLAGRNTSDWSTDVTSITRRSDGRERTAGPLWLVPPLLLIVGIPIADHFLGPDLHIRQLLNLAPALAAVVSGPRVTALFGGMAVAALLVSAVERHVLTTQDLVTELISLIVVSGVLVLFCYLRDKRERELIRVRHVSDVAQRVVLRPLPERSGPVTMASVYRAAEADVRIGGDLYAVARTSTATRLIIGDVKGHGLGTISDNATLLGAFRAIAHLEPALPALVGYLEGAVRWGLEEIGGLEGPERFVTALVAEIADDEPVVRVVSCGHPPPLLLRDATATPLAVPDPAPPLGLGIMPGLSYTPTVFPFAYGDRLLLYTDGVTETRDRDGVFYPLAERVAAWAGEDPAELTRLITGDLLAYAGGSLQDDMAMIVAARVRPPGPPARPPAPGTQARSW